MTPSTFYKVGKCFKIIIGVLLNIQNIFQLKEIHLRGYKMTYPLFNKVGKYLEYYFKFFKFVISIINHSKTILGIL